MAGKSLGQIDEIFGDVNPAGESSSLEKGGAMATVGRRVSEKSE